ncbi:hypothetical protein GCM10007036_43350 [Alsobacter metallidurans]|uniref:Uncharacterized protein n=1 Tax=Alsobacter metallidurans TaxID=340221 RepID=A0A917IBM8_9HYPH|nr:hypothetical protein [Alsobacter metallidurans]GGH31872.1 hypothetical protein GCM10007036_43350 [Alsobacter metallidurans]
MSERTDALARDGVLLARAASGFALPVIDVTHPRFAVPDDDASVGALRRAFMENERGHARAPRFLMRWIIASAARKSRFLQAVFNPGATFLDGITTYAMKLGEANLLPPFDGEVDRSFARSPHVTCLRLRMQQTAALIADAAARELSEMPGRPLHLVDIAGGPAMDAVNALIFLARSAPELLGPVRIVVLDPDESGPAFGAAALRELAQPGRSLHGLDVSMQRIAYDWAATAPLDDCVAAATASGAVIVASSEGGLFEYGSDEAIVRNLTSLHAAGRGARAVIGSVTSGDEHRRRMVAESSVKVIPRGLDGFAPLAARAGYAIARSRPAIVSDQVELVAVRSEGE